MSIGASGRIVIEIEKDIKRELYSILSREGLTLKEWFLQSASTYICNKTQYSQSLCETEARSSKGFAIKN